MTDIIEKLTIWPAADGADALAGHFVESLMQEAAAEITKLRAERDAAARCVEFTKWAIQDSAWQGGDLDGGAVQDKAEALGVIVKVPFDPAKHNSDYAEPGDDWFEFAPDLPASAILATDGKDAT